MAFIEPLACVAHAMKRFRVTPGDDLLLFGAGPMGQLLVQVLRHSGAARVVVVDKQPERLALATRFGAAATVVAGPDQKAALAELAPHGFGAVVDATGVPAVIEQALGYLRPRGSYLQFGVAPKDATVRINPYEIFKNDWSIIGSFALCYTFQPAIAWLAGGVVDVEPLVSHTLPMNRFAEGFEAFAQGKTLKVQMVNG
jgi:threonine dehydrogenase-like Zn-dependent dehydrogenase